MVAKADGRPTERLVEKEGDMRFREGFETCYTGPSTYGGVRAVASNAGRAFGARCGTAGSRNGGEPMGAKARTKSRQRVARGHVCRAWAFVITNT